MRWSISRNSGVRPPTFATMLIAYGIATTFATWLLPLFALLIDLTQRPATATDVLLLGGITAVLAGSVVFWTLVLRSDRLETWTVGRTRKVWEMLARRVPALDGQDPAAGVADVRRDLRLDRTAPVGPARSTDPRSGVRSGHPAGRAACTRRRRRTRRHRVLPGLLHRPPRRLVRSHPGRCRRRRSRHDRCTHGSGSRDDHGARRRDHLPLPDLCGPDRVRCAAVPRVASS